jgi:uncharacterized small protein (DUF1192 family)
VREKDRSNFCGFFQARSGGVNSEAKAKEDLRKAAESLFKKS